MAMFEQRVRMLEALTSYSSECAAHAGDRLALASERGRQHANHICASSLTSAPCIDEPHLAELARHIENLVIQCGVLDVASSASNQSYEALTVYLEQRRIKHGFLNAGINEISRRTGLQVVLEEKRDAAHAAAGLVEARAQAAFRTLASRQAEADAAKTKAEEAAQHAAEMERRAAAEKAREAERAEARRGAPALLKQAQGVLEELLARRADLVEGRARLEAAAARHQEARAQAAEADAEAQGALHALAGVRSELTALRSELSSETVLTEEETERLRKLAARLQPACPRRIRAGEGGAPAFSQHCDTGDMDPPEWSDALEREYRDAPHFRSFSKLCGERERLWAWERAWIEEVVRGRRAYEARLAESRAEQEAREKASVEEEGRLRQSIATLEDAEGHRQQHEEAQQAAAEAHAVALAAGEEATAVAAECQLRHQELERSQGLADDADAALAEAKEVAVAEAAASRAARLELQGVALDLEQRKRGYLEEWRALEVDGRRLRLLQERVQAGLGQGRESRELIRGAARALIERLQDLDRQLDVDDFTAMQCNEGWIPETGRPLQNTAVVVKRRMSE